jgi:hypothetical protein
MQCFGTAWQYNYSTLLSLKTERVAHLFLAAPGRKGSAQAIGPIGSSGPAGEQDTGCH